MRPVIKYRYIYILLCLTLALGTLIHAEGMSNVKSSAETEGMAYAKNNMETESMAYRERQDVLRDFHQPVTAKVTPVSFTADRGIQPVPNLAVGAGEYIYVMLTSAGATGFEWKPAPFALRGVRLIGSRTRMADQPGLAGGPVMTDFLFQVNPGAKGDELICFILYRSWEGIGKTAEIAAMGLQYQ